MKLRRAVRRQICLTQPSIVTSFIERLMVSRLGLISIDPRMAPVRFQ
jgi:hypothetical protein